MKDQKSLTVVMLLGCVVALVLRLWQTLSGFEADTGLAIAGHPAGIVLVAVLVALALVLLVLCRKLPGGKDERPFEQVFFAESAARLTVLVTGIFMMAAGGALQLLFALMGGGLQSVVQNSGMMLSVVWMGEVSPKEVMLLGALAVASAVCLFPAMAACRRGELHTDGVNGSLLLVPVVCLVVRLVMLYRINSIDPVLQAYYVELLAVAFAALAFYQLAGFAFGQGKRQWYGLCSGLAVVLCVAALGDGHDVSGTLFYGGCALSVLGFWLLYRPEAGPVEEATIPPVN